MPTVVVARVEALRPRIGHQVTIGGRYYAIWLLDDGSVRVLDNECCHVGGPLVDGAIRDGCVICPWHGWTYDLLTGERQTPFGPMEGVRAYRAWIDGDMVVAELPAELLGDSGS